MKRIVDDPPVWLPADNPLAWHPNPRRPFQVRIHRADGVGVWTDHVTMRAAELSAIDALHHPEMSEIGPSDLVEVVDARKARAEKAGGR